MYISLIYNIFAHIKGYIKQKMLMVKYIYNEGKEYEENIHNDKRTTNILT